MSATPGGRGQTKRQASLFCRVRQTCESDADKCRRNGWTIGTRLVGDEGYGVTVIEITAIGKRGILAIELSHNGRPSSSYEGSLTLSQRDWQKVGQALPTSSRPSVVGPGDD
jgi:hypothetical protein